MIRFPSLLEWNNDVINDCSVSPYDASKQRCDILARDTSFGDESTPLHKAAAGGRYLAVHMLLEAWKQRRSESNDSQMIDFLRVENKAGKTPLEVATHHFSNQDTERDSVARWDSTAGGVADWGKCIQLLEAAEMEVGIKEKKGDKGGQ